MVLDLVVELCKTLAAQKIDYCHWKSNFFLDRSASGENDLDLLVNRNHAQSFTEILYRLGFKETLLPHSEELPGVRNYYGYDQKAGKWIHIHAHFQLILGNDLSKNYRLPVEHAYLASSKQEDIFRVPAPEFELVVLVIRLIIKHSTWDTILMRHGEISPTEKKELESLSTPETLSKVEKVLFYFPTINKDLFGLCLNALQKNSSYLEKVKAGEQLQKALRACARNPKWIDIVNKFFRRVQEPIQRRIFKYAPKNRFANGGLFVAIVGGDGSGKTTIIEELHGWLSKKYEVKKLHLGKPVWSRTTVFLRALLKVGTFLRLYPFEGDTYEESTQPHGFPWYVRSVCTARDRYLTYLQARRFSTGGGLILCDRYPLPGFMSMDGPQCEAAMARSNSKNKFLKFLTDKENFYYQQIQLPDLLIVLKVDPEITVRRKTIETATSVRARTTEVWKLDWKKLSAFEVDASRSKEEALSQVRTILWEHL